MPTHQKRFRSDDGTAIIEFAFVAPLLIILFLGIFESGMVFRSQNQLEAALRLSARTASNQGPARTADWNSMLSLQAQLGGFKNMKIDYVIVYRGDPTNGALSPVPPTCVTAADALALQAPPYSGTAGYGVATGGVNCNIYSRGMLAGTLAQSNFGGSGTPAPTTCAVTDWDRFWCPTARINDQQGNSGFGPDVIGMYAKFDYTTYTKLFFTSTMTLKDGVVMRLEPAVS